MKLFPPVLSVLQLPKNTSVIKKFPSNWKNSQVIKTVSWSLWKFHQLPEKFHIDQIKSTVTKCITVIKKYLGDLKIP